VIRTKRTIGRNLRVVAMAFLCGHRTRLSAICVHGAAGSARLAPATSVQGMETMYKAIAGAVVATVLASIPAQQAYASDKADVVATIRQYNDAFNKGDTKAAGALCAPHTIIIDDFAPFAWQGATACKDWADALATLEKKDGISNDKVTRGKAWHVTVTGDRAYAVYPTRYSYRLNGKPVAENGVWTFAMEKAGSGWRIAGWAWAQH